jgi:hypothetical protein
MGTFTRINFISTCPMICASRSDCLDMRLRNVMDGVSPESPNIKELVVEHASPCSSEMLEIRGIGGSVGPNAGFFHVDNMSSIHELDCSVFSATKRLLGVAGFRSFAPGFAFPGSPVLAMGIGPMLAIGSTQTKVPFCWSELRVRSV